MFVQAVQATGAAVQLWDRRRTFWDALRSVAKALKKGRIRIVIFGAGGVGKTTLARLLSGEDLSKPGAAAYRQSIDIEEKRLKSNVFGACYVAPGQVDDVEATWPELYRHLSRGERAGVINVTAFGYHSIAEIAYTESPQFREGMTKDAFMAQHLTASRDREVEFLQRLAPHLKTAEARLWALTVVTKQDLWWPDRAHVRRHYEQGDYGREIEAIRSARGGQRFTHKYLSASLVLQNFAAAGPEVLAPTAAGYDDDIRYANLQALVEAIETLAER